MGLLASVPSNEDGKLGVTEALNILDSIKECGIDLAEVSFIGGGDDGAGGRGDDGGRRDDDGGARDDDGGGRDDDGGGTDDDGGGDGGGGIPILASKLRNAAHL